jgi:molybdate transport system ATP-binding protein
MSRTGAPYLEVDLAAVDLRRAGRAVLRKVSWTIRTGQRWVLAGGNGAGKTQLLKVVAGIVWPEPARRAAVRYQLGRHAAATAYGIKEHIAYVGAERQDKYERYGWNMAARRIVGTGLYRTDIPLDPLTISDGRRIQAALAALGAATLASRPFLSLSYGERRVVLLARALVSRPRLLLLDEVLNGLDEVNRRRIRRWLARSRKLPWVLATHQLRDVPDAATHALVLDRGRVVYAGRRHGAPLSRWLGGQGLSTSRARATRRSGARFLLRLHRARVYLEQRLVLTHLCLTVRAGEWWIVHGHNGSGKTTLLRTLYGDHAVAVGGTIERAGVVSGVPLDDFKRRVGLVAPHLQAEHPRTLTVAQVVQSGRHASIGLNEPATAADRRAARRALTLFGLGRLARRPLAQLSYGQARRVLFARAWVREPQLFLLDEPLAGVDAPTRRVLLARLRALASQSVAVIVTAHAANEWAACATHELELAHGRPLYCGPLRQARAVA